MSKHYHELTRIYGSSKGAGAGGGPIILVNLIDKKSTQGRLGRAFELVHGLVAAQGIQGGGGGGAGVRSSSSSASSQQQQKEEKEDGHSSSSSSSSVKKKEEKRGRGGGKSHQQQQQPPQELILTWFDFHHECRQMRWDRLGLLLNKLDAKLKQQGQCVPTSHTLLSSGLSLFFFFISSVHCGCRCRHPSPPQTLSHTQVSFKPIPVVVLSNNNVG